MSKQTFMSICEELRQELEREDTNMRRAIDVETHVAMTLYYIADEGRYRKTANSFGVGRSTVSMIIRRVTTAISTILGPKYIKLPLSLEEVDECTSQYLRHHGFPQ